jgi:hypothetical protein
MILLDKFADFDLRRQTYGVFSHFEDFVTGGRFTDTSADSGAAVANVDAAGGVVTLTTGATDNNECYLLSTKELFLWATNKPAWASCRLKYSEASTSAANVAFGFMNAVGADSIVNDGAALVASYSGAAFFKVDGGTLWQVETSIGASRTGTATLNAASSLDKAAHTAASTDYQWLDIEIIPFSSTQLHANFYINSVLVQRILQTYTNVTEMAVFAGVKAGSGSSEVVSVDFLGALQKL